MRFCIKSWQKIIQTNDKGKKVMKKLKKGMENAQFIRWFLIFWSGFCKYLLKRWTAKNHANLEFFRFCTFFQYILIRPFFEPVPNKFKISIKILRTGICTKNINVSVQRPKYTLGKTNIVQHMSTYEPIHDYSTCFINLSCCCKEGMLQPLSGKYFNRQYRVSMRWLEEAGKKGQFVGYPWCIL